MKKVLEARIVRKTFEEGSQRVEVLRGVSLDVAAGEMPVDTATWANLTTPAQCYNRVQDIAPTLQFTPGSGQQELMLIRVCIVADPFLQITGLVLGMPQDASGGYNIVSHAAFANEPT